MPDSWYRTGPLYDVFKQELGDEAPQAYERFMQTVAATSPKSKVPDNIRTASYYYHLDQTGQPIPDKPDPGYGSVAQKLHRLGMASKDPRFLADSVPEGDFNPRKAYAEGKLTIEDALKEPTYWESAPNKNEYAAYEAYQQKQAKKMGMTPAEWREKMWVGGGKETGLGSDTETFLRTVAKRVQYTAARLGVDPQVVLQKFVRGEIPLLSLGAGGVALGGLSSDKGQPKTGGGQ